MKKLSVKTIVAIGIGAALFFVFGRFVSIPSPVPNTNITIQYGVLAFIATVFGPIAGLLTGLIGHFLIDFSWGSPWWSWILASGFFGLVMGFVASRMKIDDGEFKGKDIAIFNIAQVVAHLLSWVIIAPVLDIIIYKEPANKVFVQGLVSAGCNAVITAIIGTILCVAYAVTRPQKESLKEEE